MSKKAEVILREGKLGILATVKFKNPPHNVLSAEVLNGLEEILANLKSDEKVKAVIIQPDGVFSVGANVDEIWDIAQSRDKVKGQELLTKVNNIVDSIENLGKPVIAAIDGYCLGGGNEIAMACTARIATTQAQFGQPEINLGIMPGMGGTQRLPRLVNLKKALQLLIIGNIIPANEALEIGLVDYVVSPEELPKQVILLVKDVLQKPIEREKKIFDSEEFERIVKSDDFTALIKTKSADAAEAIINVVRLGMAGSLEDGLKIEQKAFADLVMKESAVERMAEKMPHLRPKETVLAAAEDKSEEYEMLRKMVREFADNEIKPHIAQMEAEHSVKPEIIRQMAELGLFGVSFDEKYGGSSMGKVGYCTVIEELSRIHGSTAVVFGAHVGLACGALDIAGTEEQKQKYLRAGIEGKMIGAFALTEPEAGSDAANIQTKAVKKGDKWVLNGSKQFITNGDIAGFVIVIAQTNPDVGQNGLAAFIVESAWPGFEAGKNANKLGIKASRTTELYFTDLEISEKNMLGGIGQAFKIFMKTLNGGRMGLGAGCLGNAKGAFQEAYEHAYNRIQFKKPILEQQMIQSYLAEMRSKIHLMEVAVYDAARKADCGIDTRLESAILKLTCSEMEGFVVDTALQILGGQGYIEEYPMARRWRDHRINRIFEGTNEIQKLFIVKEIIRSQGKIN